MGWKKIKEHYRIEHSVCITKEGICIGSPYIHNIIVIGLDGQILKRYGDGFSINEDLDRYQKEMDADPEKLKQLIATPDTFKKSITVYTFEGGNIIENKCEKLGWPNSTHDGAMMYENSFSTDKSKVIRWAKRNAESGIKWKQERIEQIKKDLSEMESEILSSKNDRAKLETDYPE